MRYGFVVNKESESESESDVRSVRATRRRPAATLRPLRAIFRSLSDLAEQELKLASEVGGHASYGAPRITQTGPLKAPQCLSCLAVPSPNVQAASAAEPALVNRQTVSGVLDISGRSVPFSISHPVTCPVETSC